MIRIAFSLLLLVHGGIHLLGFAKAFGFAEGKQIAQNISRRQGLVWFAAALCFVLSLALFLVEFHSWWLIAALSVLLSQVLIVQHWQDAKVGTLANGVIAVVCVVGYGTWSFTHTAENEVKALLPAAIEHAIVFPEQVSSVPPIVQQWLRHTGTIGREVIQTAHVYQRGEMRTTPEGSWMPVQAEQWFTTKTPAFLWFANVGAGSFVQFAGRDIYHNGRGNMVIKLFSLVSVVDATGPEINQGSLVRYLAEIIWFPSAALSPYITWETIDNLRVRATIAHGNTTASGIFTFTKQGQVTSFEAQRYYTRDEGATLELWSVAIESKSEKIISGLRIPAKATVTWKLPTGDFTWYKLEITDAEYNTMLR